MKHTKALKGTLEDSQMSTARVQTNPEPSVAGAPVRGRLSKTNVAYWQKRLTKRKYKGRDGEKVELPDWSIRLRAQGSQQWYDLGTPNQAAAAKKAADVHRILKDNGPEAAKAFVRGGLGDASTCKLKVGDYLRAVSETSKLRERTFLGYQNCLRTIIAGAFGIQPKPGESKFDHKTGGNLKWTSRIDDIRLERLTPDRVTGWLRKFVKLAGKSPKAIASAKRSANSYVRNARSLFGEKIKKGLRGVTLPAVLPFDGVTRFESGNTKFISQVNVRAVVMAARVELKDADPEAYKVFLLGFYAGMRRAEIDLAEWRDLDCDNNVIRVQLTDWLHLKSAKSEAVVPLDPEVVRELRAMMTTGEGDFIVKSNRRPRNDSARAYMRCKPTLDRLYSWLRGKGITANKPLHELRKEIGAIVNTRHGIFASSTFLRHSDITTTTRAYVDKPAPISTGLGGLLTDEIKIAEVKTVTG